MSVARCNSIMWPSTSTRHFAYMTIEVLEIHTLPTPFPVINTQDPNIKFPEMLFPCINLSRIGNGDAEMLLQGRSSIMWLIALGTQMGKDTFRRPMAWYRTRRGYDIFRGFAELEEEESSFAEGKCYSSRLYCSQIDVAGS